MNALSNRFNDISINEYLVLLQTTCFDIHCQVSPVLEFPGIADKFFQAFAEISRLKETMHSQSHSAAYMNQPIGSAIDLNVDAVTRVPFQIKFLGW